MCSRTSPWVGAYTGASSCFKLWSAVTCSDGFGSGVDKVFFPGVPFVACDVDSADIMSLEGVSEITGAMVSIC